jgi:hypothetical protein
MHGKREAPDALDDPQLRATGALVATLSARRDDWVSHTESVAVRGVGEARRRVAVEFELPAAAWELMPGGGAAIVPLGLLPKAANGDVSVRDESGARVEVVPSEERARIAAAGLLAVAAAAGAGGAAVSGAVWGIVAGARDEADEALEELARGASDEERLAWKHPPFRLLAEQLADRVPLLVALPGANAPRRVTYEYDDRTVPPSGAMPLVALAAALLLGAESLAAGSLARDPGLFALALVVPMGAAYLARGRWGLAVVVLCLAGQLLIAVDASEALLRAGAGVLAGLAVVVAALLFPRGA